MQGQGLYPKPTESETLQLGPTSVPIDSDECSSLGNTTLQAGEGVRGEKSLEKQVLLLLKRYEKSKKKVCLLNFSPKYSFYENVNSENGARQRRHVCPMTTNKI